MNHEVILFDHFQVVSFMTATWSIDDYHQMISIGLLNDRQVELLRGEIIEMTPEGISHAANASRAAKYLTHLLGDLAEVRDGHPITLPDRSEPEPDIAIVRPPDTIYDNHHPYPEDILWLIEYSDSTLAKDLGLKRDIYAGVGIPEYWVVNLRESCLMVFRDLKAVGYQTELRLVDGEISPIALPHIQVELAKLFVPTAR